MVVDMKNRRFFKFEKPKVFHKKKKELQQKFMLYQFLGGQVDAMGRQLDALYEKISEFNTTIYVLEELGKTKSGEEMLVSIGSGIFIDAKIEDVESVLENLGAGAVSKKKIKEAIASLEEKKSDFEKECQELQQKMNEASGELQKVYFEIEKLSNELKINK